MLSVSGNFLRENFWLVNHRQTVVYLTPEAFMNLIGILSSLFLEQESQKKFVSQTNCLFSVCVALKVFLFFWKEERSFRFFPLSTNFWLEKNGFRDIFHSLKKVILTLKKLNGKDCFEANQNRFPIGTFCTLRAWQEEKKMKTLGHDDHCHHHQPPTQQKVNKRIIMGTNLSRMPKPHWAVGEI